MPIKPELRYFYPIDWPQISHWVRFVRAKGRCRVCGRPHGETVQHLGDGRWWEEAQQTWRDGRGRRIPSPALTQDTPLRTTNVVLAHISIMTRHIADAGTATSGRSASGATCCMTGPSTAGGSG